ncbi:MAG: sirohydrochlorin chelatase [Jatrophihabitantaceae bacterium]
MRARLLLAAHGTRSAAGAATTAALTAAVAAVRPSVAVTACFLDVASPSLRAALDALDGAPVVVVPLLLSAGYHVTSDIPAVAAGRPGVRVARHLGPDQAIVDAVAARLADVDAGAGETVLLAAIASSRSSARAEVDSAAALLSARLSRPVTVLPLSGALDLSGFAAPLAVAVYLLAEGGFLDGLRAAVAGRGVVAEPIGVHPALVSLVWSRYDEAVNRSG